MNVKILLMSLVLATALAPSVAADHVAGTVGHWCDTGSTLCNLANEVAERAENAARSLCRWSYIHGEDCW